MQNHRQLHACLPFQVANSKIIISNSRPNPLTLSKLKMGNHIFYNTMKRILFTLVAICTIAIGYSQSITNGSYNEIIHAAITEPDVGAVIDRANDEYQRRGLRFRWNLSPGHAPDDLGERLAARGFTPSWGRAMARSTQAAPPPADVEIVRVDAASMPRRSRSSRR